MCDPSAVHEWGPDHLGDLVGLTDGGLPDERLTSDELLACCWDDPGVVFGLPDATGAVSAVMRQFGDHRVAFVKLLVVSRGSRRHGHGRALLAAAEQWAWDAGAGELHLSGSAPAYLWPGVDVRATAMLCLAEAAGYEETGAAFDMSVPAGFRHPVPDGSGDPPRRFRTPTPRRSTTWSHANGPTGSTSSDAPPSRAPAWPRSTRPAGTRSRSPATR